MLDRPSTPMLAHKKMRRMLLLPCLGVVLFLATYFPRVVRPALPTKVLVTETATVTVRVHETVTQQLVLQPTEPAVVLPDTNRGTLKAHKFRPDGLLEVDPSGRHPIYDLIERAEKDWAAKVKRQSKTLDEAVTEYERRYKRAPPKGFDDW